MADILRRLKIIYYAHFHKLAENEKTEDRRKIGLWCEGMGYDYFIIDPSDVHLKKVSGLKKGAWMRKFEKDMEEVFFPLIDTCDIVIYSNKEEEKAIGVKKELEHALIKEKLVIRVDKLEVVGNIDDVLRS